MDFPGRLIAGLLIVILIFVYPLQYIAQTQSESIDYMIEDKTRMLVNSIRENGCLSLQMYEEYIGFLDSTGDIYDIKIQDIRPVKGTELSLNINNGKVSLPRLVSYERIMPFSLHAHTDDCYNGMPHICNGYDCVFNTNPIVVAYGASSPNKYNFYYSTDGGITFLPSNFESSNQRIVGITYGNGKFVAIGSGGPNGSSLSYVSTDGINWTAGQTLTIFDYSYFRTYYLKYYYITYENGYFYLLASAMYNGQELGGTFYILRSSDGLTWESIYTHSSYSDPSYKNFLRGMAIVNDGTNSYIVILSSAASGVLSSYKLNSSTGYITDSQEFYTPTAFRFCQVGPNIAAGIGNESFVFTASGCTYIKDQRSNNLSMQTLQYGNSIYLGINNNEPYIRNSSTAWTFEKKDNHNLTFPGSPNWHYMIYAGNKFMLVSDDGNRTTISFTLDGENWSQIEPQFRITNYFSGLAVIAAGVTRGTGEGTTGPCLKEGKYYDSNGNEVQPICDKVVTYISAAPTSQTVCKGQDISLTVTATYLDGHTAVISNFTTNYDKNKIGTQLVTITYSGLVGNAKTIGTRTCLVEVNVVSDKVLFSISVTPESQEVQKYSYPLLTVTANYDDGSSQIIDTSAYTIEGYNAGILGKQFITISYTENEVTKTSSVEIIVVPLKRECLRCHNLYELNPDDTDPGCPYCKSLIIDIDVVPDYVDVFQGDSLPITVIAIYSDGSRDVITSWTSNYDPGRIGLQNVTVEYGGYAKDITVWVQEAVTTCPVCFTRYPLSYESCPICADTVVSISVSPKEVTIKPGDPLPITVTAYFADGSSRIVEGWEIDVNTMFPGKYIAIVNYKGATDTMSLTILSFNTTECPICGTIYDMIENPKGCPICSNEIVGIEAYFTSGSNLVQYGTMPSITVVIVFRDEHRELTEDGYSIDGFNPYELGHQTITVSYKGFYVSIEIEVVNMLNTIICPKGHVYYKDDDGSDPGCPFCRIEGEVSNVLYFDIKYTYEILDEVYYSGVYYFKKGNYISIRVVKKDKSILYRLQRTFFFTSLIGRKREYIFGGEVF